MKVHRAASQASSTVLVDEQYVIVYFGSYGLLCYDHDGNETLEEADSNPPDLVWNGKLANRFREDGDYGP